MKVITRFAPSPTGHVHIGNMRSAIYSWLFARHHAGEFILRIEDTDRERSTPEAVQTVLDAMKWLGLNYDGEIEYQSGHVMDHIAAAEKLLGAGYAYKRCNDHGAEAVVFRIPWNAGALDCIRTTGTAERKLHPEAPVEIGRCVSFAIVNKKDEPTREEACLAGFEHMLLLDAAGKMLFSLDEHIDEVLAGASFSVSGACLMKFSRREVFYRDLVKGEMSKALDGIKDLVIVRADNTPVFHLANVCDDVRRGVTHIIRGDDHVENTFRHILLFHALGAQAPEYAHLPMVVNAQGKPYSKRDGDAFVGDFREQGYLGDALFNYLALLGWSPGGDREIMARAEMAELFDIAKIRSSPTQVDLKKLLWMNGAYMAAMPKDQYEAEAKAVLVSSGLWNENISANYFRKVLILMAERIKLKNDFALMAGFFFTEDYRRDEKAVNKRLRRDGALENLAAARDCFLSLDEFSAPKLEAALQDLAESRGVKAADFIHPLRVAVSGLMEGPGLFDMLELLGRDRVCSRVNRALKTVSNDKVAGIA